MKNNKRVFWLLGFATIWAICSASAGALDKRFAGGESVLDGGEVQADDEIAFEALGDELHTKVAMLESQSAIHYYSFKALRGQKVLLAVPVMNNGSVFWDVEYLEGNEWKKLLTASHIFSEGTALEDVKIRVSPKKGMPLVSQPYSVIVGSLPVLKDYELRDQFGINRIPSGYTSPSFLMTQGYTHAYLEAHFTDTKGHPLKGALGILELDLKESGIPKIVESVVSNDAGRVSKVIDFGRCYGGRESAAIKYYYGDGVWRSYYYVGSYYFRNQFYDPTIASAAPHDPRTFGHVCRHRKVGR